MIRRIRAALHALTAPRPAPARPALPPMRDASELPQLRLVVTPNPVPGGPADLVLVRRTKAGAAVDAFVLDYGEFGLLLSSADSLRDSMAKASPHYQPAEVPPSAETLN